MKTSLFLIVGFLHLFMPAMYAQTSQVSYYKSSVQQLTAKYQLDKKQSAQVAQIVERKQQQLAEISQLIEKDPTAYYKRLEAIQKGTLVSLSHILTTEEQRTLFNKTRGEVRKKRADLKRALLAKQADADEVLRQTVLIHAE